MRYSGVQFDPFGTLIPPFRMREHMDVLRECAHTLGISFAECHRHWEETYLQRTCGEFVSIADGALEASLPMARGPREMAALCT